MTTETAVAVLNAAMRASMFPEGAIPESDKDKVEEAQKIIVLAQQAKDVADQIGPSNMPKYPLVRDVLQAAGVWNGEAPPAAEQPLPSAPPTPVGEESGTTGTEQSAPAPVAPSPPPAPPPPAEPVAAPVAPPVVAEGPVKDETWIDSGGQTWIVVSYGGAQFVEVRHTETQEITVVPLNFLVQRAPAAQEPPPSPSPQPSPVPASPPPSSPSPLPSPETAPTPEPTSSVPSGAESPAPSPPPSQPSPSSTPSSSPEVPARAQEQQLAVPIDDDEGDERYGDLLEGVTRDYTPSGMPAPMDLDRPPSQMPDDLTAVSDIEARRLHSQFNALGSRARYLHGLEAAKGRACGRVRREYLKIAMRTAREELGKDASVTEVTNLAEDNEDVATWIDRERRHADRAEAYETFLKFYTEDVTVLSRDWTMRSNEEAGS